MGRFDKFAENAGEEIKPVAISKKQIIKKSDKTKSIKIRQETYDKVAVLKTSGAGSLLHLLDEAVDLLVEERIELRPELAILLSAIEEMSENPNQTTIEDYL